MPKALCIGVTGHRFLAEEKKLRAAVRLAMARLRAQFPKRPLRVLSSLAEGADRSVVQEVLKQQGTTLVVALPLPVEDYRQDFATPQFKAAFTRLIKQAERVLTLPPAGTRNQAYEQAGQYVVDHCDALIALWDGQEAQGRGGTADMVRRALARGVPVFHIKAGNRKPGTTEPTTLGDQQGELVVYNL